MEYEIYIENDGGVIPYDQPVMAMSTEEAVATAAGILRARPGSRSIQICRNGVVLAVIED